MPAPYSEDLRWRVIWSRCRRRSQLEISQPRSQGLSSYRPQERARTMRR